MSWEWECHLQRPVRHRYGGSLSSLCGGETVSKERQSTSLLCNHNYPLRVAFELEHAPVPCHAQFILPDMFFCTQVSMKQRKHTLHGQEHEPLPQYRAFDWKTPKLFPRIFTALSPEVGQMLLCLRTDRGWGTRTGCLHLQSGALI